MRERERRRRRQKLLARSLHNIKSFSFILLQLFPSPRSYLFFLSPLSLSRQLVEPERDVGIAAEILVE
jgi:hypothetical protein